jgi:hypothetical protein
MRLAVLNHLEEVRFSELTSCGAGESVFQTRGACPPPPIVFLSQGIGRGADRMTRRIAYSVLALSLWFLLIVFAMSGRV